MAFAIISWRNMTERGEKYDKKGFGYRCASVPGDRGPQRLRRKEYVPGGGAGAGHAAGGGREGRRNRGSRREGCGSAQTLVSRLTGVYYGEQDGEYHTLELFEFGGNLLGQGGIAEKPEGNAPAEPYSFWALEVVPADAEALLSTQGDSFEAGVLQYSVMSNMDRYWGAPEKTTVRLTDKGIILAGTVFKHIKSLLEYIDQSIFFIHKLLEVTGSSRYRIVDNEILLAVICIWHRYFAHSCS